MLIEIIPDMDILKIGELTPFINDDIVVQVFSKLSKDKLRFCFPLLSVSQFWNVLNSLTTEQIQQIIPYISNHQRLSVLSKHYSVDENLIEHYFETYTPAVIALGFTFISSKHLLIHNCNVLTRQQLCLSVPNIKIDDIFKILEIILDDKKDIIINNISPSQMKDIEKDLDLNFPILSIRERFLKNACLMFERRLQNVENMIREFETLTIELIDDKIEKIQKDYMDILNKKYELKKSCDKYNNFSTKLNTSNLENIQNLCTYLKTLFAKIQDFQKRIDAGDGTNGVINKLVKMTNKYNHEMIIMMIRILILILIRRIMITIIIVILIIMITRRIIIRILVIIFIMIIVIVITVMILVIVIIAI